MIRKPASIFTLLLSVSLPLAAFAAPASGTLGTLPAVSASASDRPEISDAAPPAGVLTPPPAATRIVDATTGPLLPGPDAPPPSEAVPQMPAMPVGAVAAEKSGALLPPVPPAKPAVAVASAAPEAAAPNPAAPFKAPPADVKPIDTAIVGPADVPAGPNRVAAGPALAPPEKGDVLVAESSTGDPDVASMPPAAEPPSSDAALPPPGQMAEVAPPPAPAEQAEAASAVPPLPAPKPAAPAIQLAAASDTAVAAPDDARGPAPGPHVFHRLRPIVTASAPQSAWDAQEAEEDLPVGTEIAPRPQRASETDAAANIDAIENGRMTVADTAPIDEMAPAPRVVHLRPAAEECRPYTRRAYGGFAAGTACLGSDGVWRIVSEHPLRVYRRPIITASLY